MIFFHARSACVFSLFSRAVLFLLCSFFSLTFAHFPLPASRSKRNETLMKEAETKLGGQREKLAKAQLQVQQAQQQLMQMQQQQQQRPS